LAVWWQSHALFLYLYVKYGEWLWSALRWFARLLWRLYWRDCDMMFDSMGDDLLLEEAALALELERA